MKVFSVDLLPDTIAAIMMTKSREEKPLNDEKTESRVLTYSQKTAYRLFSFVSQTANALLRCEARNTEASAFHLNH